MSVSEAKRLKEIEAEDSRLEKGRGKQMLWNELNEGVL